MNGLLLVTALGVWAGFPKSDIRHLMSIVLDLKDTDPVFSSCQLSLCSPTENLGAVLLYKCTLTLWHLTGVCKSLVNIRTTENDLNKE